MRRTLLLQGFGFPSESLCLLGLSLKSQVLGLLPLNLAVPLLTCSNLRREGPSQLRAGK